MSTASRASTQRRLAWAVFTASAVLLIGSIPVRAVLARHGLLGDAAGKLSFLTCPLAGILIARRHPGNRIAWILLAIGAIIGFGSIADQYTAYGLVMHPGSLPGAGVVTALSGGLWVPGVGLAGTYLLLLFPDGQLPSPRWRAVAWASGITMGLLVLTFTFAPGTFEQNPNVSNPLGIAVLKPVLTFALVALPVLPLCMFACAAGLVMRFRRSRGIQRLQVKWLATAAALVASVYLVMMVLSWYYNQLLARPSPHWLETLANVAVFSFMLIPLSIGVAVLKHGLYGIDRLISRTVSYAVITGALLAVYFGLVTAAGSVMPKGNSVGVAGATLVVAALFQPLRRRVQAAVDRRFNRARYDSARTIEAFSTRLRDEVDLDSLRADLVSVVRGTMQPATVGLWLRSSDDGPT
ncbi:MAG: hypothetical protein ABJA34_09240 [Pseudonocardiales bacterium]